jgi:hypothetical protein
MAGFPSGHLHCGLSSLSGVLETSPQEDKSKSADNTGTKVSFFI